MVCLVCWTTTCISKRAKKGQMSHGPVATPHSAPCQRREGEISDQAFTRSCRHQDRPATTEPVVPIWSGSVISCDTQVTIRESHTHERKALQTVKTATATQVTSGKRLPSGM